MERCKLELDAVNWMPISISISVCHSELYLQPTLLLGFWYFLWSQLQKKALEALLDCIGLNMTCLSFQCYRKENPEKQTNKKSPNVHKSATGAHHIGTEHLCGAHFLFCKEDLQREMQEYRGEKRGQGKKKEKNVTPSLAGPCHQLLAQ